MPEQQECICALATAPGIGAIAIIRVSGKNAIGITNEFFVGKDLNKVASHTVHFGIFRGADKDIDEVLLSVFKAPHSFTKEDSVEISCHGSSFIIQAIMQTLVKNGCRMAQPGEFTQRAFLNGRFDLVQAEAVADLIHADSEVAHRTAFNQLRGGFSDLLAQLREELIHFASLVELELDFGEEDVEFADRDDLRQLIFKIQQQIEQLLNSFESGNAMKEGIPVAIIGQPNVGKSTLLNALFKEEKAIVTDVAGTTRDTIEDTLVLGGYKFRFIDTAGIRETTDKVEKIGIEKSKNALNKAEIVLCLYDEGIEKVFLQNEFAEELSKRKVFWIKNKVDLQEPAEATTDLRISAKNGTGIKELEKQLEKAASEKITGSTILTNLRHFELLSKTNDALNEVLNGLDTGITGDFLAQDIRLSLFHLGELTGTISTDDLLKNIFGKFCIGK